MNSNKIINIVLIVGTAALVYDQLARRGYVPKLFTKKVTKPEVPVTANVPTSGKPFTIGKPSVNKPAPAETQGK